MSVSDFARRMPLDLVSVPGQRARPSDTPRVVSGARAADWQRSYRRQLLTVDVAAATAGGLAALLTVYGRMAEDRADVRYLLAGILLPLLWVGAVSSVRAYEDRFTGVGSEEFRRVTTAALWLTVLVASMAWLTRYHLARGFVVA